MNARDLGVGVASAIALLGLLAVFTSAVDASALAGGDQRPLVGVVATAFGTVLLARWYRTEPTGHEPRERERVAALPVAGSDVDEVLALAGTGSEEVARFYSGQARDRLEAVAVAVLATHRGDAPEDAREQLRSGTWTEDPVAAQFFVAGAGGASDLRGMLATATGSANPTTRRARRAVAELRRIAGAEGER